MDFELRNCCIKFYNDALDILFGNFLLWANCVLLAGYIRLLRKVSKHD